MLRLFLLLVVVANLLAVLGPGAVSAGETLRLDDHYDLVLEEALPAPWSVEREPPDYLVEQATEHAKLHLEKAGRTVPGDLPTQVRSRLAQNELFLVNQKTRAHLDLDISRPEAGVVAPRPEVVAESARQAEVTLENEPEISQLQSSIRRVQLAGVDHAYLLEADFLLNGEFRRFRGVIGTIGRDWLFLYFTGYLRYGDDWPQIEQLLQNARFSFH